MTFIKKFFMIFQAVSFSYVAFRIFLHILLKIGNTTLALNIFNSIPSIVIDVLGKFNFVFFAVAIFSVLIPLLKLFGKVYCYYLVALVALSALIIFNNWIFPIPGLHFLLLRFPMIGRIVGVQYAFLALFGPLNFDD